MSFHLLEVRIKTGRTHQIRVHLSAIGHPVVGDDVYGERSYKEFMKKIRTIEPVFSACGGLAVYPSVHRSGLGIPLSATSGIAEIA